jgi:hypothetical protein
LGDQEVFLKVNELDPSDLTAIASELKNICHHYGAEKCGR